ncbi:MAG: DbpA RNA binding domain-containing protein [Longimicrobiales bacterium]|nr:DbpA RNA binding domain-containing protein [Longimicrobiales bacterium]
MDTFEDLNLAPELVAGAEALGWSAPAGLQKEATAVIRRGNNVVLHGSAGSGVVGAYGLGVLDHLLQTDDPLGSPAALVLVPDFHTATAVADSLGRLAVSTVAVRALGPGWARGEAQLLVASASAALDAVRSSALKLDGIRALVIDGADLLADAGHWAAVETLTESVPGQAQRVVVTGRFDEGIDRFLEGHVRRAMTVPPRSEPGEPAAGAATLLYTVVPEREKLGAAVRLLDEMGGSVAVVCRTVDRADAVERGLAARGVMDPDRGTGAGVLVLPRTEADQRSVQAAVLSHDVPFDAGEMEALHEKGGAVLVTPREQPHLLRIARRAGLRTRAVAAPAPPRTAADEIRDRLRALVDTDLTPELALLAPLLEDLPAVEVAAAAVRLTRGQAGEPPVTEGPSAAASASASAPAPQSGTWVHLFMSIGSRDDVGPGDILGAITGEAGVSGDRVGKIDVRESHSTVEVATPVAGEVIRALNGRTLKGRSLRVDYDRKGRGAGRAAGRS